MQLNLSHPYLLNICPSYMSAGDWWIVDSGNRKAHNIETGHRHTVWGSISWWCAVWLTLPWCLMMMSRVRWHGMRGTPSNGLFVGRAVGRSICLSGGTRKQDEMARWVLWWPHSNKHPNKCIKLAHPLTICCLADLVSGLSCHLLREIVIEKIIEISYDEQIGGKETICQIVILIIITRLLEGKEKKCVWSSGDAIMKYECIEIAQRNDTKNGKWSVLLLWLPLLLRSNRPPFRSSICGWEEAIKWT